MRTLIPTTLLCLVILAGCSKKQTNFDSPGSVDSNALTEESLTVLSTEGFTVVSESDIPEIPVQENRSSARRNGNSHIHGHFTVQMDPFSQAFAVQSYTATFSAVENKPGVSGTAQITTVWGANGEHSFHINLDAECMEVNGSEALFGGVITNVSGTIPSSAATFPNGTHLWFRVKDNGKGPSAPADQASMGYIFDESSTSICNDPMVSLNSWIWWFVPMANVTNSSDNIVVK